RAARSSRSCSSVSIARRRTATASTRRTICASLAASTWNRSAILETSSANCSGAGLRHSESHANESILQPSTEDSCSRVSPSVRQYSSSAAPNVHGRSLLRRAALSSHLGVFVMTQPPSQALEDLHQPIPMLLDLAAL